MNFSEAIKLEKQLSNNYDITIPPIEWIAHPFTQAEYDNWAANKLKTQQWISQYSSQIKKSKKIIYLIIDTAAVWNFSDMQYCVNPKYCFDATGTGVKDDHGHSHMIGTTTFHKKYGIVSELTEQGFIEVGLIKSLSKGGGQWQWIIDGMKKASDIAKENPNKQVIVNCSFGAPNATNPTMSAIAKEAKEKYNVIWIGSIGNSGQSREIGSFPGIDISFVGVGAVDINKKTKSYSSKSQYIDTTSYSGVPGYDHLGNFGLREGTSFSSPNFAALLSLALLSGVTSVDTYMSDIKTKGIDLGQKGFDDIYGYGLLDFDTWTKEAGDNPVEEPVDDTKKLSLKNIAYVADNLKIQWDRRDKQYQFLTLNSFRFDITMSNVENTEDILKIVNEEVRRYFSPYQRISVPEHWDVQHLLYYLPSFFEYYFNKNRKLGSIKIKSISGGQFNTVFTLNPDNPFPFSLNNSDTIEITYKK